MASAADRHLLFGLLALQNGIINQGQLVAAFQAWTLDKSRSLADHLEARGDLTIARRVLLEALAGVHLEAHGGDVVSSLGAISTDKATREGLARIGGPGVDATLGHVGSGPAHSEGDANRTESYSVGSSSSDGQRFRVLRPHARGGLGVVFVALDGELNREVALKQILDKHADDPVSRQRFLIEAEITGGLEHPGIVPVYGLGNDGGGRPYYAMRFIRGDSLKEAIDRFHGSTQTDTDRGARPLELRKLLRRFVDVCNAIEYAHSRGIVHRDIKPANVIVGNHGETLVVDWGLAKPIDKTEASSGLSERTLIPTSACGSVETLPGSAMGTPAYMSPEQAAGDLDRLRFRSDVYSLGATLYCLLTGKAPFDGDIGEVLRKVQRGEFVSPRQVDPNLDPALEAVCLKAMATRLEDRYSSCRALAEDVERWAADEPVGAWREPLAKRARRWSKRNRTAVTGAAVALVAGVVGLAAVLAVQTQAKADIARSLASETRANTALAAANSELTGSKAAVVARYALAVDAIKTFHTGVSEDFLLKEGQFKELRDRLLKSASDFYGKLGALLVKETDTVSRRSLAQANFEVAELTREVGRPEDALAAHWTVLALREALATGPETDTESKVDIGRSLTAVAYLLEITGKTVAAEATYRRAETLLADVVPSAPTLRAALAACRSRYGFFLSESGRAEDALATYRLARADQEALVAAPGAMKESRRDLAETINRIGIVLIRTNKLSEAEVEFRKALALRRKLADDNPATAGFRGNLADTLLNIGRLLWESGKAAEGESWTRKGIALYQKLADDNPAVNDFRHRLAASHQNLGSMLADTGKLGDAEAEYHKALTLFQKLADDNPTALRYQRTLASILLNTGWRLALAGKSGEAIDYYIREEAVRSRFTDERSATPEDRNLLANCQTNMSDLLRRARRLDEAWRACDRALALREPLVRDHRQDAEFRGGLAETFLRAGQVHLDAGDLAGASAALKRALALYDGLQSPNGEQMLLRSCCHAGLAGLAARPGAGISADEGRAESDRAMSWVVRAVDGGYRNPAPTATRRPSTRSATGPISAR